MYGGQDLKDGAFNDMWRLDLNFMNEGKKALFDENEIYDIGWEEVK